MCIGKQFFLFRDPEKCAIYPRKHSYCNFEVTSSFPYEKFVFIYLAFYASSIPTYITLSFFVA